MAKGTGGAVAMLTAAALAVVGFLGYQADATAPAHLTRAGHSNDGKGKSKGRAKKKQSTALPSNSGSGPRVVYSVSAKRVWLVEPPDRPFRTFRVQPSSATPLPGTYAVSSRTSATLGSDGVRVEDVVVFHTAGSVVFGFSTAVSGSTSHPTTDKKTGGIREPRADATAMWAFAQIGTRVVVLS